VAAIWADPDATQSDVSLVLFDIDHFKQFNDAFGHQAGDECLSAIACAVSQGTRSAGDTLVRYGGEEFAVILPRTSLTEGIEVAERLRATVMARGIPHPCVAGPGCITVSLGVATMRPEEGGAASLIERADRCLYAAKRAGRNRVAWADETAAVAGGRIGEPVGE
jgi:diguanylate cyclase (GGDEF)-like protein